MKSEDFFNPGEDDASEAAGQTKPNDLIVSQGVSLPLLY